jgi:hypothetical protein
MAEIRPDNLSNDLPQIHFWWHPEKPQRSNSGWVYKIP